jgi:SAM-dependent methyltransferase
MKCHCCNEEYTRLSENVYQCGSCAHIHRVYSGDSVEYHQNQYRNIERRDQKEISESGEIQPLFHEKRKQMCEKRMSFVQYYITDKDRCLDVGAGAGTFANLLRDEVNEVSCTELSPMLIRELKKLNFDVYEKDFLSMEVDKKFDVVSAWHVLEHVEDIESFMKKTYELSNRYVIIEVPLLAALNGQGRKRKLTDPKDEVYDGHTHYFSEQSFRKLTEKDFNIVALKEGVQSPALFAVLEKK